MKKKVMGHKVYGDPKRKHDIGDYVRRRGPVTVREVAIAKGIVVESAESTLASLEPHGFVAQDPDGRWRWTGGAITIAWSDLAPRRRLIVELLLTTARHMDAGEIAEALSERRDGITDDLLTLDRWGWAARRKARGNRYVVVLTEEGERAAREALAARQRSVA